MSDTQKKKKGGTEAQSDDKSLMHVRIIFEFNLMFSMRVFCSTKIRLLQIFLRIKRRKLLV